VLDKTELDNLISILTREKEKIQKVDEFVEMVILVKQEDFERLNEDDEENWDLQLTGNGCSPGIASLDNN
jgi:hypothetical protein